MKNQLVDGNFFAENKEMFNEEPERIDHPMHYGGKDNPYEVIKVIEAWKLGFNLGNVLKYIKRSRKKDMERYLEDLKKAAWYLNREIEKKTFHEKAEIRVPDPMSH